MSSIKLTSALLLALGSVVVSAQQHPISGSQFKSDPLGAASAAAPAWHMDSKTCMPANATNGHGGPNPGLPSDNCNELKINHNCTPQPPQNGQNTESTPFDTYYTVRSCDDGSWRVVYDVYFQKDTGHRHDWEWAAIKFLDDGTNTDNFVRDGVWFEQDGKHPYVKWGNLDSTYTDDSDIDQNGQKGKDHAKFYFGKWHHPVFPSLQTKIFANTCPPISQDDYRSDDYRYEASKTLVDGSVIDPKWNYGSADSYPPSFGPGGKFDVCKLP